MSQQDSSRNLVVGFIAGFLVIAAVASIVVKLVDTEFGFHITQDKSTDTNDEWKKPISQINVAKTMETQASKPTTILETVPSEDLIAGKKLGKEVYDMACMACHAQGLAEAPKLGDQTGWANRISKGEATLISNAINGFNVMPPRGGRADLGDKEIKWAVRYMMLAAIPTEPKKSIATPEITPVKPQPKKEDTTTVVEPKKEDTTTVVEPKKEDTTTVVEPKKEDTIIEVPPSQTIIAGKSGKEVYDMACTTCHALSVAGAPKLGDKAGWANRISKGEATLVNNVINGFNVMPPRGGNAGLSDAEIKRAVQYILAAVDAGEIPTPVSEPAMPNISVEEPPAKPVETPVKIAPSPDVAGKSGKEVYDMACTTCHTLGIADSPKLGDKASWANRIIKGETALVNSAINGLNIMPPRGGNAGLSDAEIKRAVRYMLINIGVGETSIAPSEPTTMPKPVAKPQKAELAPVVQKVPVDAGKSGKKVYDMVCTACHTYGVAGSPKLGDKASWANRITKGETVLVNNVINGFNVMPPRGGNAGLSDAEVKLAVRYMLAAVGVSETSTLVPELTTPKVSPTSAEKSPKKIETTPKVSTTSVEKLPPQIETTPKVSTTSAEKSAKIGKAPVITEKSVVSEIPLATPDTSAIVPKTTPIEEPEKPAIVEVSETPAPELTTPKASATSVEKPPKIETTPKVSTTSAEKPDKIEPAIVSNKAPVITEKSAVSEIPTDSPVSEQVAPKASTLAEKPEKIEAAIVSNKAPVITEKSDISEMPLVPPAATSVEKPEKIDYLAIWKSIKAPAITEKSAVSEIPTDSPDTSAIAPKTTPVKEPEKPSAVGVSETPELTTPKASTTSAEKPEKIDYLAIVASSMAPVTTEKSGVSEIPTDSPDTSTIAPQTTPIEESEKPAAVGVSKTTVAPKSEPAAVPKASATPVEEPEKTELAVASSKAPVMEDSDEIKTVSPTQVEKSEKVETTPVVKKRITIVSGVNVRSKSKLRASRVGKLEFGTIVKELERSRRKAKIKGSRDYWYKIEMPNGKVGWTFGSLSTSFDETRKGQIYLQIARERLHKKLNWSNQIGLLDFIARAKKEVRSSPEISVELVLLQLSSLQKMLASDDYKRSPRKKNWLKKQEQQEIIFFADSDWVINAKPFWRIHDAYYPLQFAERVAWAGANLPLGEKCEGSLECALELANNTTTKYLKYYPSGKYVEEALDDIAELLNSNKIIEMSQESDLPRLFAVLQAIVDRTNHSKKTLVLNKIEELQQQLVK